MNRPEAFSRRALFRRYAAAAVSGLVSSAVRAQPKTDPAGVILDHLLLGVSDLDSGIAWVERTAGVRAAIGGVHPGRGTRNALVSLGRRQYLEIIAPDPAQPPENLTMNLRELAEPRLIAWAAATTDIDALAKTIRAQGIQASAPREGSRARPDGQLLKWRAFSVTTSHADGNVDPIPFFIQWAAGSPHPSQDSPKGCELASVEFGYPDPDALKATLQKMGIDARVGPHKTSILTAALTTPKGRIVLE